MRLTTADRLNAIKRHPQFIKDKEALNRLKKTSDKVNKWAELRNKWGASLEAIESANSIDQKAFDSVKAVTTIKRDPIRLFSIGSSLEKDKYFFKGERLYLEVDIFHNETQLKKDFELVIKNYKALVPKDKTQKKEMALDPWEVYDMVKQGLNFSQIARKKSGLKGSAVNNPQLESYHKQVTRAYDKAKQMIDFVNNEVLGIPVNVE